MPSAEFAAESKSGRTIAVASTDDAIEAIDLLLVESIEVGNGRRRRRVV